MVRVWVGSVLSLAGASAMAASAALAGGPPQPDRILIPAGTFIQGSTHGEDDERPQRVGKLPAFRIDRTEVTRAAYAQCVTKRRCPAVEGLQAAAPSQPDHPITHVTWSDARAYCRFVKGRLPSEAEWEKAARGNAGRMFPWGDQAACSHANWGNFGQEGPCAETNPGHPVAVGSYPLGSTPEGVADLGGNVWEWVQDAYEADPSRRVVKGGSCCGFFVGPRASNRNAWAPSYKDADLGFRCVYR